MTFHGLIRNVAVESKAETAAGCSPSNRALDFGVGDFANSNSFDTMETFLLGLPGFAIRVLVFASDLKASCKNMFFDS